MYEWGYCSYKSPPSCGISERNNCGSSPGHLLGENPVCVYILVDLAGAWLPLKPRLPHFLSRAPPSISQQVATVGHDVSVGRLSWWTPTGIPSWSPSSRMFLGPQSSGFPSGESGKRGQLSAPKRVHFTVYRLKESLPDSSKVKWASFENLDFPGPGTLSAHTHWAASVAVQVCLRCSVSLDSIVLGFFSLPQCQVACV